jgi:hypothetical protein
MPGKLAVKKHEHTNADTLIGVRMITVLDSEFEYCR